MANDWDLLQQSGSLLRVWNNEGEREVVCGGAGAVDEMGDGGRIWPSGGWHSQWQKVYDRKRIVWPLVEYLDGANDGRH